MSRRRALILSGRFGKGHDTVAEATATVLESIDVESKIIDCIELLGGPGSQIGERVFRTILDRPPVYDAFHFNQLRPGRWLARRLDEASLRVMWPRFVEVCEEFRPDLILSVFASGAAAASRYKAEHPEVTTAVFITDAAAHAMWVHPGTDVFMVPSTLGELAVRRYEAGAHVCHVTHPTRPAFYDAPSKAEARAGLGIPIDARCVLLMSGAWGVGPVAPCAQALADDGSWVLAVAGSNAKLAGRLRRLADHHPHIIPFGFTDRVPELMAACDVVVSSPGDTCREARWSAEALSCSTPCPATVERTSCTSWSRAMRGSPPPNRPLWSLRSTRSSQIRHISGCLRSSRRAGKRSSAPRSHLSGCAEATATAGQRLPAGGELRDGVAARVVQRTGDQTHTDRADHREHEGDARGDRDGEARSRRGDASVGLGGAVGLVGVGVHGDDDAQVEERRDHRS